ncbi:hypothetical protein EDB19DRAFT_1833539 [Suillus lakei]|nr:hypothetical protein EDB19DRAFT_1833539 [Suillus lakei]
MKKINDYIIRDFRFWTTLWTVDRGPRLDRFWTVLWSSKDCELILESAGTSSFTLGNICLELWNPSTPPTSPQRAQAAAHQAERNQRNLGSPPARRHPNAPAVQPLLQNAPQMNIPQMLGNLNHGPIPMQRFPGLPRNVVEHHEAQRMWRQHHPQPAPPPVPALALAPPFGHIPAPAPAALQIQNEYERRMANVAAATMNNLEARRAARRRRNNPQPPPPPPPAPAPAPAPPAPPIWSSQLG